MTRSCWILTDDQFMKPSYRISPFTTSCISLNSRLPDSDRCNEHLDEKCPGYYRRYLLKARHGITLALENLALQADDLVTILTTTGNFYVSGCVTAAIEKVCTWNREINDRTKAIVVVHEFGKVYEGLDNLCALGKPIIEDYAHSYNSKNASQRRGDFIVYSFPKFYPVQFGGILFSKHEVGVDSSLTEMQERYIKNAVSEYSQNIETIRARRRENYSFLANAFSSRSAVPRFEFKDNETPSVFMFRAPDRVDLVRLKAFMQRHGVECSVFYGEQTFFLPVHDGLRELDLEYFVYLYDVFCTGEAL